MQEVRIEADPLIADQVSFDTVTRKFSYSGEGISLFTSPNMVQIKITFVNSLGENPYSQTMIVYASDDPHSEETVTSAEQATSEEEEP